VASSGRSLNRRLTQAIVVTTAVSLLLACAAFVLYDRNTFEKAMIGHAGTLAEVVGINSAISVSFLDPESATQTLSALSAAGPVLAAVIYDEAGNEFAHFARAGRNSGLPGLLGPAHERASGHLDLRHPIVFDGARIGTIVIRWDMAQLTQRTLSFAGIAGALLVGASTVGWMLAMRLRQQINRPLSRLVGGSQAIARGDLSAEVPVSTDDELGVLGRTFNLMTSSLRELAHQVSQGTRDVGSVTRELEESAGSLAHQARRQAAAIEDTTESVAQVGESIRGVNQNVEELSRSMAETSSSIAEMQASTTEVAGHMDHLASSIETTSSAVSQVAANTHQVVSGLETLNQATDEAVTSLEQLKSSVGLVTDNAQTSHTLSEDTSKESQRGLSAVNETISAMGEISTSFQRLEQTISELAEKSVSIDEVLKVIQNVADSTGLLSLNASIIAAQAGEHGKPFAVVADEVNNLAQSTHRSTTEISRLIREVHQCTAAAVAAAEEGAARVEIGVQRSNVAGEVLSLISEKSLHSTEHVHEILEATSVQLRDLQKVDESVAGMDKIVEQFARSARDQQGATTEILRSIESIRDRSQSVRHSMEEQERGAALITHAVTEVSNLVARIAEATQAQAESSESIEHALGVFREVSNETTARAQAINEIVATLSDRARRLENEASRFRTVEAAG
jgi:methyl-accepting chemotaxis protein